MNAKAALETIQNIENNIICIRETTMVAIKESLKQLRALERQLKKNVVDDIIVIKSDDEVDNDDTTNDDTTNDDTTNDDTTNDDTSDDSDDNNDDNDNNDDDIDDDNDDTNDDNKNDQPSDSYPETEDGYQSDDDSMDDIDEEMSEDFGPFIKRKLEDPCTPFSAKRQAINVAYHVSNKRKCHFENNDCPKRVMLSHDKFPGTPPKKRNIRDVHDQTSVYLRSKYDERAKRPKRSVSWQFPLFI